MNEDTEKLTDRRHRDFSVLPMFALNDDRLTF